MIEKGVKELTDSGRGESRQQAMQRIDEARKQASKQAMNDSERKPKGVQCQREKQTGGDIRQ